MPAFSAAVGATQKIFEITERVPTQVEGQLNPQECKGHLQFEKVCFHYATRHLSLQECSFVSSKGLFL